MLGLSWIDGEALIGPGRPQYLLAVAAYIRTVRWKAIRQGL
jgi:hypothetical protein